MATGISGGASKAGSIKNGKLLARVSGVALALALMAAAHRAEAAAECGADAAGADTITCAPGAYPSGITYTNSNGLTLNLNNPLISATGAASASAVSISSSAANTNTISINAINFGLISASGTSSEGILALNNGTAGDATVTMDGGTVRASTGTSVRGVMAQINSATNAGTARVTLNGGAVTASGGASTNGLYAVTSGTGTAEIVVNGGSATSGSDVAAVAWNQNVTSGGLANIIINGGSLTGGGGGAVATSSLGEARVTMNGGSVSSAGTVGVSAFSSSSATTRIIFTDGVVTATGANAMALRAMTGSGQAFVEMSGGNVTASGAGGVGILASTSGSYDVSVTGGTVTGGSGSGAAIQVSAPSGAIRLGAGAVIDGSASGVAIRDTITNGNATITTAGTLKGAVVLGNGSDVVNVTGGSINGNISGGGSSALNFDLGSGGFTYGAAYTISGMGSVALTSGTLRIDGALSTNTLAVNGGTLQIAGTASAAGGSTVTGGTLAVNGVLLGTVMVTGGRLQGIGTVGATTIATGGTIAPGNSIGTLTVNGAYLQSAGAVYEVEIDPATTTSDRIQVNGTATLASGAAIAVVNYTGAPYLAGQRFTILTSTGLTGSYGFGEQVLTPFLNLRDTYDVNNAYLTVIQTRTVASAGSTGNQAEVGRGVDSLPAGNSIQTGMINQPTLDSARTGLDALSGEIYASAKTALIDESWLLRAAVNDRLRSAFGGVGAAPMATLNYGFTADLAPSVKGPMPMPTLNADRFAVWGQGYGSWGRSGSDGNAARLTHSTGGFLIGADAALFDTLRIGAVAGYSRSVFDVNSRFSSGESDNYHLGLYGGGRWGALSLRTGASYSWHDVETSRTVVSSAFGSNLRAGYDAGTTQIFGELGYRVDVGKLAFEPFAGLAYVNLHTDGFSETGGSAALTARGDDTSLGYSTLGLRASSSLPLQGMELTLRGGLAWRHAFGDVDPTTTLAFAGSGAFSIAGIPIARDAAVVEAGLDLAIGKSATLGLAYTGQLAQDTQDHAFKGVLAVRF